MFEALAIWLLPFLSILLKDLWTGLFLFHRHLHQSGALTMEALQDPPSDPMEGMEEDIADKVGPEDSRHHSPGPRMCAGCRGLRGRSVLGCVGRAAFGALGLLLARR